MALYETALVRRVYNGRVVEALCLSTASLNPGHLSPKLEKANVLYAINCPVSGLTGSLRNFETAY